MFYYIFLLCTFSFLAGCEDKASKVFDLILNNYDALSYVANQCNLKQLSNMSLVSKNLAIFVDSYRYYNKSRLYDLKKIYGSAVVKDSGNQNRSRYQTQDNSKKLPVYSLLNFLEENPNLFFEETFFGIKKIFVSNFLKKGISDTESFSIEDFFKYSNLFVQMGFDVIVQRSNNYDLYTIQLENSDEVENKKAESQKILFLKDQKQFSNIYKELHKDVDFFCVNGGVVENSIKELLALGLPVDSVVSLAGKHQVAYILDEQKLQEYIEKNGNIIFETDSNDKNIFDYLAERKTVGSQLLEKIKQLCIEHKFNVKKYIEKLPIYYCEKFHSKRNTFVVAAENNNIDLLRFFLRSGFVFSIPGGVDGNNGYENEFYRNFKNKAVVDVLLEYADDKNDLITLIFWLIKERTFTFPVFENLLNTHDLKSTDAYRLQKEKNLNLYLKKDDHYLDTLNFLLQDGVEIGLVVKNHLLLDCIKRRWFEQADMLLEQGADINYVDDARRDVWSSLFEYYYGIEIAFRYLIEHGFKINYSKHNTASILQRLYNNSYYGRKNFLELLQYMFDNKIKVGQVDRVSLWLPFFLAKQIIKWRSKTMIEKQMNIFSVLIFYFVSVHLFSKGEYDKYSVYGLYALFSCVNILLDMYKFPKFEIISDDLVEFILGNNNWIDNNNFIGLNLTIYFLIATHLGLAINKFYFKNNITLLNGLKSGSLGILNALPIWFVYMSLREVYEGS